MTPGASTPGASTGASPLDGPARPNQQPAVLRPEASRWEPGAPSLRAFAPGAIGGGLVPLAVYYAVRSHVNGDALALMIAGAPAAAWVGLQWMRKRSVDPIGCIVLFGFVAGVLVSVLMGDSAFVLKVRDSAFTALFGLACMGSLFAPRPLMFYIGRALSAGNDPDRVAAYDELWTMPTAPRTFRIITAAWAFGLVTEAVLRVVLAEVLPTGAFLAASPALAGAALGGLFAFTVWFSRRARRLGEGRFAELGLTYPSV